jgi:SAM-dependent methyltransferase
MAKASSKLDLGCGLHAKRGWVNVDIAKLPGVDIVWDLEKRPWPLPSNTFTEMEAHHVLEHLSDLVKTMEEIHHVCKDGAILRISVPYFASPSYNLDPTHKRKFNLQSFQYFTKAPGYEYYSTARITILKRRLFYLSCKSFMKSRWYSLPFDLLINLAPTVYQRLFVYLLPASEIHFILRVEKPTRRKRKK